MSNGPKKSKKTEKNLEGKIYLGQIKNSNENFIRNRNKKIEILYEKIRYNVINKIRMI